MSHCSQAFQKAKNAIQQHFPSLVLPNYARGDSILDLINSIADQTGKPQNKISAIQRMKMASDAQQYRIQRSYLEMDKENHLISLQEICYELPSTGIFGEKDIFINKSERSLSEVDEKMHNLIDEVWWTSEKRNEQESEYFME